MAEEKGTKRSRGDENSSQNKQLIAEFKKRTTELRKQFQEMADDTDNVLLELGLTALPQDGDNEEQPNIFGLN